MIHVLRMGTFAEKDYVLRATAWYDELLLNANLLDGTASASSYLAFDLRLRGKGFFIDPVTYAFALDPAHMTSRDSKGRTRFKRTFLSLARQYGLIADDAQRITRLRVADLQDRDFVESFCRRVLTYQQNKVPETLVGDADFIADEDIENIAPSRLIAPYFFLDQAHPAWQDINANLVRTSAEIAHEEFDRAIWAVICFDSLLLDQDDTIDQIAQLFGELPCEGYALWLTDFDEQRASRSQVRGLARLLSGLKEHNPQAAILDMYGGFFAAILRPLGMDGISHGVGYGERRGIVPVVGGGPPPARYYLPPIHEGIYIHELVPLAEHRTPAQFRSEICNCIICRGLLQSGVQALLDQYLETVRRAFGGASRDYPSPTVYRLTKFHFLHNRHLELRSLETASLNDSIDGLMRSYEQFEPELDYSRLTSLRTWSQALEALA